MKKPKRVSFTKCRTNGCTSYRPTREVKGGFICCNGACPTVRRRKKS